jgi:hypothetical protein
MNKYRVEPYLFVKENYIHGRPIFNWHIYQNRVAGMKIIASSFNNSIGALWHINHSWFLSQRGKRGIKKPVASNKWKILVGCGANSPLGLLKPLGFKKIHSDR